VIPAAPGKHRRSAAGPRPAPDQMPLSAAIPSSATIADAGDRDWPPDPGGSAWPARNSPLGLHPDHPSAPLPRIPGGHPGQLADPTAGPPGSSQRWSAHPAGEVRITDSLWLAGRVLTVADNQAVDATHEAWGQAAAIRDAAEREAATIRRQASDHAAAIREAAERDAAELRAAVLSMSGELGRVAAFVTENLAVPAMPATKPARPAASPTRSPTAEPDARPAKPDARPAKPDARPAKPDARPAKPAVRPAKPTGKATGRPRQYFAMRLTRIAVAAMVLFAVTAGSTEIALRGLGFFVFRAAGTGSTPDSGLKEDQGPGQPDAPGTHRQLTVPKHKPTKHHHHHPGASKPK
jgi:hypothetical protein